METPVPDTTTEIAPAALLASRTALNRQAALPGFLARSILRIDWLDGVPDPWSLRWVIETCRAELAWSVANWRKLNPDWRGFDHEAVALSEPWRLPHERAAAKVLNAWGHVHLPTGEWHEVKARLRAQLKAAADTRQSLPYRLQWLKRGADTRSELDDCRDRRRKAWPALLEAIAEYRAARAEIDGLAKEAA